VWKLTEKERHGEEERGRGRKVGVFQAYAYSHDAEDGSRDLCTLVTANTAQR